MQDDYDKKAWQADQEIRDADYEKQREKTRKARKRAASKARRKLERLHRILSEAGDISDFEDEFGQSVLDRLDKYDAAFCDFEKGRSNETLSFAQKSVIAAMQKKVKALEKNATHMNEATESAPLMSDTFGVKGKSSQNSRETYAQITTPQRLDHPSLTANGQNITELRPRSREAHALRLIKDGKDNLHAKHAPALWVNIRQFCP